MSDQFVNSDAELLRRAAATIRAHVTAIPMRSGRWVSLDGGDRLMDRDVALAMAGWLRDAADEAEEVGPNPWAVATARAVLRETQP